MLVLVKSLDIGEYDMKVAIINQVRVLGKKPEFIQGVIEEVDTENWGYGGMTSTEYRRVQLLQTALAKLSKITSQA